MNFIGIGDMAQQFTLSRNTTAIKTDLARLTESLSTGKVDDLTVSLGGDTARYSSISYDLAQIGAFEQTAKEVALSLESRQIALERFDGLRSDSTEALLRVNDLSNGGQISQAANLGRQTFDEMVDILNLRLGDRSLFAGTSVTSAAVIPAEDMLNAISATLPPAATAADIIQAVNDYFHLPAGGFETAGYLGGPTTGSGQRISEDRQIMPTPSADDSRFRDALASAAMASMVDHLGGLNETDQRALLEEAGQRMYVAGDDITAIRAEIGAAEETVAEAQTELQARRTALGIARNGLDQSDPYETATALQGVQLQLEMHFSTMSRLSQLSLLRFI